MEKKRVREEIIKKRNNLSSEIKKEYDELIFKQLIESDIYKRAKKIFTYVSFGSEIDTIKFIKYALNDNKEIYIPKTDKSKKEMVAIRINSLDNMSVDKWGILEPKAVDKNKIEKNFDLKITRSYEKRVDGKNNYDYYLDNVLEFNDEISFFYENYLNCTDIGDGAQFNDNITNINGLYMSLNHIPLYFDFNKIISEDITVTLKFLNHFIRKSLKNDLKNTLIFGLTG